MSINNTIYVRTLIANAPAINGIRYLEVPLELLEVHPTIQRDRKGHERRIAANWDDAKCGCILVSYRDDHLYIIDGQHRYWAAQMIERSTIACRVVENLTERDEALLFGQQDENRIRLTTVEKVKALVIGQDTVALTLKRICDDFKLVLIPHSASDSPRLTGIRAATLTMTRHGEDALRWVFHVIDRAKWRDMPRAYSEDVIVALRNVYTKYGNDQNVAKIVAQAMYGHSYSDVLSMAHSKYIGCTNAVALSALFNEAVEDVLTQPTAVPGAIATTTVA